MNSKCNLQSENWAHNFINCWSRITEKKPWFSAGTSATTINYYNQTNINDKNHPYYYLLQLFDALRYASSECLRKYEQEFNIVYIFITNRDVNEGKIKAFVEEEKSLAIVAKQTLQRYLSSVSNLHNLNKISTVSTTITAITTSTASTF